MRIELDLSLTASGGSREPPVRPTHEVNFRAGSDADACIAQIKTLQGISYAEGIGGAPGVPPAAAALVISEPMDAHAAAVTALPCVESIFQMPMP